MERKTLILVFFMIFFVNNLLFAQSSYKVIINSSNPVATISKTDLSKLFLKKTTKWENGNKVQPVDLLESSAVRVSFTKEIHDKSISAIKSYWQRQLFSGRAVPPPEKANDKEVLSFVKANSGAIGYVSTSASTKGVKVIKITKD